MMQRLSDEELEKLMNDKINLLAKRLMSQSHVNAWEFGFRVCEDYLIPQLEKMQEDISSLKAQSEIDFMQMQEEIERLTAKHDRLVKVASTHIAFPTSHSRQELKNLLTESEGE